LVRAVSCADAGAQVKRAEKQKALQLGLGRACALQGDKQKSRAAYQDFLALWKDADPDIPVLKQAKPEYAKVQSQQYSISAL